MATEIDNGFIRRKIQKAVKLEDREYLNYTAYIKHFISELVACGVFLFFGCLGVHGQPDSDFSHFSGALTFGMAAFVSIQIAWHNSGGHINPALTIAGYFLNRVSLSMAITYIIAQCIGAILGYGLLLALISDSAIYKDVPFCLTRTLEGYSLFKSVIFELIMTAVLVLVVSSIWDSRNGRKNDSASLKYGFTIFMLVTTGRYYTGCSLNPARSLGPAIWQGNWENHWVFWVGPIIGSLFASISYKLFFCGHLPPCMLPGDRQEAQNLVSS